MTGLPQRSWPKRRYPRYTLDRPLLAHLYCDDSSALTYRGRCHELSEGGIGAALAEQLPIGEVVTLEFSPTLKVYGTVRYMHGFYHGFEFVLLRDRQREAIKSMVAAFARRHHGTAKRAHA
jgi:hypothetical protein